MKIEPAQVKSDLAIAYQTLAYLKYDDHTYTHLSSREPVDQHAFYIYPFGLRFEEVTPDCLMKVSLEGQVLQGQEYQYNKTGYILHGAIYKHRPDIQAVFHLHTPESVAVSAQTAGLLPISQWALHFYERLGYHAYDSLALNEVQGNSLIQDLGHHFVLFLRNHGFIACGRSIAEALFYTYHLQRACETQCLILSSGVDYVMPEPAICKKAVMDLLTFEKNLGERDFAAWKRLVTAKQ